MVYKRLKEPLPQIISRGSRSARSICLAGENNFKITECNAWGIVAQSDYLVLLCHTRAGTWHETSHIFCGCLYHHDEASAYMRHGYWDNSVRRDNENDYKENA